MNWMNRMMIVINYIEEHLKDDIDYTEIDRLAICGSGLFQRVFTLIVGIPLSEYIRLRRLSEAGQDLLYSKDRIIDIALRYGYDSPDAFTAAFKKWHRITPSQARLMAHQMKYFPKLTLEISIQGGKEMVYRIMDHGPFQIVGKSIHTSDEDNKCPQFWEDSYKDKTIDALCKVGTGPLYGACYNGGKNGTFQYLIGIEPTAKPEGWEVLNIPASKWAIFQVNGPMPQAIIETFKYIFTSFFGNGKYRHAKAPDLEVYYSDPDKNHSCRTEVWVPIVEEA